MVEAAQDSALVAKDPKRVMATYGSETATDVVAIPAVKILNGRGEYSMSMGVLPAWWRPFVRQLPWYRRGQKDVKSLAGIAIMAVARRLATSTDRVDLLSKLKAGVDSDGNPMGREELTAEALTLLIAGSDTTSKYIFSFSLVTVLNSKLKTAQPAPSFTTWLATALPNRNCTKSLMNNSEPKTKRLPMDSK